MGFFAHGHVSPKRAKANIIRTLRKYFDDASALEKWAVDLAHEAVNLQAVRRKQWSKGIFNTTLLYYQRAAQKNSPLCFDACRFWEDKIENGLTVSCY